MTTWDPTICGLKDLFRKRVPMSSRKPPQPPDTTNLGKIEGKVQKFLHLRNLQRYHQEEHVRISALIKNARQDKHLMAVIGELKKQEGLAASSSSSGEEEEGLAGEAQSAKKKQRLEEAKAPSAESSGKRLPPQNK